MRELQRHYETIRKRCGYDPVDFEIGGLPASYLRRKFAAADDRTALKSATPDATIFTTGVGMTGPPHLGTLGQILNAIELQERGFDVQFVLADLEPYHYGAELEAVTELAERYRAFVEAAGFDPEQGWLRTQEEAVDVMHTAQLLARDYRPDENEYWPDLEETDWEKSVAEAYDRSEDDGEGDDRTSEAADVHSSLLHLADFVHPLLKMDYEQVVVALGADEHALTVGARRFLRDTPVEGSIAGLHSRMIPGTGNYPKMSKSIPESVVNLDMDAETIRERIVEFEDSYDRPAESSVFRMMCLASAYSPDEIERMHERCVRGGEAWASAREEYADHVIEFAGLW